VNHSTIDDLSRQVGSDLARLRRLNTSLANASLGRAEDSSLTPESKPEAHGDSTPGPGLTELDRCALFTALTGGTEKRLERKPTASEFVRLCEAVSVARQLVEVERGLLTPGELEIHWTGVEWSVQAGRTGEGSQAA
jgi:hypothetical protein